MSGDGILMNFEISDAPIIPKPIFKGGRWRDRLIAKKCAAKRESRGSLNLSEREIFRQNNREETEEYIGHEGSPKSTKRRRIDLDTTNPNHIFVKEKPEGSKTVDSGEQNITAGDSNKLKKNVAVNNDTRSAFISGKLPAGSIINSKGGGLTNGVTKKIVFDDTTGNDFKTNQNTKNKNSRALTNPQKSGQIISSLFSYNPSATNAYEKQELDIKKVEPSNAPLTAEMETFTALGLSARLAAHLSTKLSMKAPTAIQKAAIPIMIKDQDDAFIQAETGSGKTLAYLLPIVHRIIAISEQGVQVHRDSGLFAIVLSPTRELCKQIASVLDKLLRCAPWIVGTTVIGGESKQSEKARIRKGVNILIATPGRLSDHLESTEVLKTDTVRWFVMDEGDRLMELGFEEEIKKIVEKLNQKNSAKPASNISDSKSLPRRRVTILCSATMKMNVQRLGEISLKDAVHIIAHPTNEKESGKETHQIEDQSKKFSAPAQLKQAYAIVPAKLRLVTLTAILKRAFVRRGSVMKAIVFISCADSVDFHFSLFSRPMEVSSKNEEKSTSQPATVSSEITKDTIAQGTAFSSDTNTVNLYRLHGSLPQNVRTATLKAFTLSTEPCVIICTDVASRGLDLPNVDYVIEYDPPFGADDHLHRVGRTARAGKDGRALIFLLPGEEEEYISVLASGYREGKKALVSNTAEELLRKGFGGTGKEWEERATNWQLEVERWVQDSPKYLEMARRGFQSHIRAYATHVASERHIFNMQTLHLGHLAKSFALRDKPGSIKVPGLRPAKESKADRSAAARKIKRGEVDNVAPEGERIRKQKKLELDMPKVDIDDASKRMRKKIQQHMSAVTEFNIM